MNKTELVAAVAAAAIAVVFNPAIRTIISTNTIVNAVFQNCSNDCELAVAFICFNPPKYPLNTDDSATKNTPGDKIISVTFDSGIDKITFDIKPAPINNKSVPASPIAPNVKSETLKILCAALLSPTANLSETNLEIAFGIPIDDTDNNNAYIW